MHYGNDLRYLAGRVLGSLALATLASRGAPAQPPAPPSPAQILARYESFLGGAAALARVETRTTTSRRFEKSETPSEEVLIRFSKRPGFSIMHHEALDGTFIRYMNGCDPAGGWVGYGRAGADANAPRAGETTTDGVCRQEQYFYGYLPLDLVRTKENVQRFDVRGVVTIVLPDVGVEGALAGGHGRDLVPPGPRKTYLVLAVPARETDQLVWLYFDAQTGALLRRADAGRGPTPTPPGMAPRVTDFLQYRAVGDGTRAPFQFVTTAPNSQVRGVETDMVDNRAIPDRIFDRPKDVSRADKGL